MFFKKNFVIPTKVIRFNKESFSKKINCPKIVCPKMDFPKKRHYCSTYETS